MFSSYRKLCAAFVGILLFVVNKYSGLDLGAHEEMIIDIVLGIVTLAGVFYARNNGKHKPAS